MTNRCKRCEHEWESRKIGKAASCPACKSYKWDQDRGRMKKASTVKGVTINDKDFDIGKIEYDPDWGS